MAIDVKALIADALLRLCEKKPLDTIKVKDILTESGVSRQAFYNHFRDKYDLINWIYYTYIMDNFHDVDIKDEIYDHLVQYFSNIQRYHSFMKQALSITGQNCLRDFMTECMKEWDLSWHLHWFSQEGQAVEPVSEKMKFSVWYHSLGNVSVIINWVMDDMPVSVEEMAQWIMEVKYYRVYEFMKEPSDQAEA